jgi:hypothetical protein
MTEEEFRVLLKLKESELELVVEPSTIWQVFLVHPEDRVMDASLWCYSEDKQTAIENLAKRYFGE